MPTYRGVTVHVTDRHDKPLQEWGTQTRDRSHLTTCYIQSENDMAFRVSIKAQLPFPEFQKEREEEERKKQGTYERDVSDRDVRDRDVAAGGGVGGDGGEDQGGKVQEGMSGRQPEEDYIGFVPEDERAAGSGFAGGFDRAYDEEYYDESMAGTGMREHGALAGGYDGANDDAGGENVMANQFTLAYRGKSGGSCNAALAPHGYYGAPTKDVPAQEGRIKLSLKALQRPGIVKQEPGSSMPARGRALEAFDGPRIKKEPSPSSPPNRGVRDGDRLGSPEFVYPPKPLGPAAAAVSRTMGMKDIEDDTLWEYIQQQSRRYPYLDVETLLHDATRTSYASRANKCLSKFKISHITAAGGFQQHGTRHDSGDPPSSANRDRTFQPYAAYNDLEHLEHLYAKEENFDRLMTLQDVENDRLRKLIKTLKKRQRGWDWERLLLEAAYGYTCPLQAVECLQKFADAHYTGGARYPAAPYHLLATLRLDGKKTYEKRSIIYLDGNHKSGNELKMHCRSFQDQDGTVRESSWYFREVGIETVFDKLLLASSDGSDEPVPAKDDADLLAAFGGLGADGLQDAEEKLKAGQIELTLERVNVGAFHHDVKWNPDDEQDQDIDMSAGEVGKVSHTVARNTGKKRKDGISTVDYGAFCPGEPPFATFRFYYRSEEKLRRFDFDGFPIQASHAKSGKMNKKRQRKEALANIAAAPLSITAPKPPKYVFDNDGKVIAAVDVPKVDSISKPLMSVEEILAQSKASSEWTPANNNLPARLLGLFMSGSVLDPPGSPPDSPIQEGVVSDGSKPVDQEFLHQFRMMEHPGEEGDDEASDGARTPGSMGFREDNGSGVGDDADNGQAGDGNDEGIGKRLGEIELRKRHTDAEDAEGFEESSAAAAKKAKV